MLITAVSLYLLSPRIGDLRYNFVNLVDAPQVASPWGIEMDAEDPLTGEKVSASVKDIGHLPSCTASPLSPESLSSSHLRTHSAQPGADVR
jgi:hypothetical protein